MRRCSAVLLAAVLAACAATPQSPPVLLPAAAARGAPSPQAAALRGSAEAFASPDRLQGRPALAAIAVAQLEWLAAEIPSGRDLRDWGYAGPALLSARHEVRAWLGVLQQAPPQAVVDALVAAATVPGGDPAAPAALPPALFPAGGGETWRRLAAMPRLPQANSATAMALRSFEFGPIEHYDTVRLFRR